MEEKLVTIKILGLYVDTKLIKSFQILKIEDVLIYMAAVKLPYLANFHNVTTYGTQF